MAAPQQEQPHDYNKESADIKEFFKSDFATDYQPVLEGISRRDPRARLVSINIEDVSVFNDELAKSVETNAHRYIELFSSAIDDITKELRTARGDVPAIIDTDNPTDVYNVFREQDMASNVDIPAKLTRRYTVRFIPRPLEKDAEPVPLREIRAANIGQLVTVKAMVTRASDIKPLISVATYVCEACDFEMYHFISARSFMPLDKCTSGVCSNAGRQGRLHLITRGSRFIKFQELKVQELPDQVPVGHIPRSTTVLARGELTREVLPGDIVTIDCVYLPTPYTGFQAIKAGLTADTYLEAHRITKHKKNSSEGITDRLRRRIQDLRGEEDLYSKLARSIAPEIYGHEDVKKALLLQMVGGVTLDRKDGMRIRGDINICLMGDPGVAKSQLLKHIAHVAPRGVFTTGKGSSGVGLTAAVIKDPITKEMMLEGGALVLADMGICCIDEFDKMDDTDRTAIHEVMEQQTVSIAKAGITTTLNARTSILAAANPLYGRYNPKAAADPHTALLRNVNLPAALLSRFDLMFLILDKPDLEQDEQLARHIAHVHRYSKAPSLGFDAIPPEVIRAYVLQARDGMPMVSKEAQADVIESYVELRQSDKDAAADNRTILTARQLLSILRLAQAHARIQERDTVEKEDVEEAIRLVTMSKASIVTGADGGEARDDPISSIYHIMVTFFKEKSSTVVERTELHRLVTRRGFTDEQFDECLRMYADDVGVFKVLDTSGRSMVQLIT